MRFAFIVSIICLAACSKDSPTSPTPTPTTTETRVIALFGSLAFGSVDINTSVTRGFQIANHGNAPMTVTSMTAPGGYTASWTSGVIAAGAVQDIAIRFSPTEARTYNGTLTVQANQTSGTTTTSVSGTGLGPLFTKSGTGNTVFDLPAGVTRLRAQGTTPTSCENFIVRRNGSSFINAIIGTCSVADSLTYDGIHLVAGPAVIEIVSSEGVNWTFTEVR